MGNTSTVGGRNHNQRAICVLHMADSGKKIGKVTFNQQSDNQCQIIADLYGLNDYTGEKGFHIHEYGDLTEGCHSLCSHYNPYKKQHGGFHSNNRHVGDLGNVEIENNGRVNHMWLDTQVKLYGPTSVIGRSIVLHEKKDDLGLGGNPESLKTGNAGKRIACGIIGIAR